MERLNEINRATVAAYARFVLCLPGLSDYERAVRIGELEYDLLMSQRRMGIKP